LHNNPDLAALRQQHHVAAAAVVIAQTYPFNPVWTNKPFAVAGPASAGVTNVVAMEQRVALDLELHGQGKHRRRQARMALTRTDWEIAHQEMLLAVRTIRAYYAVLYRQEKMLLLRRVLGINERAAAEVAKRVKLGQFKPVDEILIRTEVADARARLASGNSLMVPARTELRRALGLVQEEVRPLGPLQIPYREWDADRLTEVALNRRADLHARRSAICEADARLNLTIADRFGNPNLGPDYEYNETRASFMGFQLTLPLPVLNTHRGEILQRRAERGRAVLDLRSTETLVRQDVRAALARYRQAHALLTTYEKEVVPGLQKSVRQMNKIFRLGDPSVDALKLISIYRRLLGAIDLELDARFELSQALADLAAAVGEPGLAITGTLEEDAPAPCPQPQPKAAAR
jgi:cobalt-zinc-cadmium efflux system outer membrane protein